MKKSDLSADSIDRRRFLVRIGHSVATIGVAGATVGLLSKCKPTQVSKPGEGIRWSHNHALPNANAEVQPVPGTRSELTPLEDHYRVINTRIPDVPDIDAWRLKITGLVEEPLSWDIEKIRRFESISEFITLTCISNPVGGPLSSTTRWTGVSLQTILPYWKLKPNATHFTIRAADGFFESLALETIREDKRVMLAYEWDGVPLPMAHGYPLRIYIPNRYGMKQPKWIESIEATDHWEPGFSVKNTWDKDAIMEATSVIDTIVTEGEDIVLIGGIAHAGSRGISRVQIQVDGGVWEDAQLRQPLSELSWVIWRYQWPFRKGEHEFVVRTFDKSGVMQKEEKSGPYPDGATGYFSKTQTL